MSFFSVRSKRRENKKSAGSNRTFVPRLEVLESRDLLSTFTVTNTSGDPNTSGSLPWAVQQANQTSGPNTIDFNIRGSGVQTINITGTLFLNSQMVIDGTSQPGYSGTPLISVQGNSSVPSLFYLGAGSSGSTIQGLDLFDYTANAVTIVNTSGGDLIQNNWVGFFRNPLNGQVSLNTSLGSQYSTSSGIGIQSSHNTIRGNVLDGGYNVIVMGEDPSATWSGTVYTGNSITGNFIGTDPSGTTSAGYGNLSDGIFLGAGCQGNFLGPSNVISGNAVHGIEMFAASDKGNVIFGNKIGTDVNGHYAIANGDGITITDGANGNTIGGAGGGNVISGNHDLAISLGLAGFGTGSNNFVQNNIIGLNASQTAAISPGSYGVSINSNSSGNQVTGNVICAASGSGVILASTTSNVVNNNWIGEASSGAWFPNGQYGVVLLAGANYNFVLGNNFGNNHLGSITVDPNAIGNDIQGGTQGGGGANNVGAQIQQLFQAYGMALQDLASGNISGFFKELNAVIALYFSILSSL
jgi:hypothetical protein